jgi:hypothetical protein
MLIFYKNLHSIKRTRFRDLNILVVRDLSIVSHLDMNFFSALGLEVEGTHGSDNIKRDTSN